MHVLGSVSLDEGCALAAASPCVGAEADFESLADGGGESSASML